MLFDDARGLDDLRVQHMTNAMLEELINHLFLKTTGAANNWFSKTFQEMPDCRQADRNALLILS